MGVNAGVADLHPTLVFPGCHPRGGVERVVWETMRYFAASGPVDVVASDVDAGESQVNVTKVAPRAVPRFLAPLSWRSAAAKSLPALRGRPLVSYGVDCPPGDVRVVQAVHRSWLEHGQPVRYGPVTVPSSVRHVLPHHRVLLSMEAKYFADSPDRVVAVSDNVSADLQRLYAVDPRSITVVPNGYAPEDCSPERSAALRGPVRNELDLGSDDVALLLVANEWHRKGLGVLLDAMARFSGEPIRLLLVGRLAPDGYARQISALGLGDRVRYCGASGDVARFYAAADLFVMPTQYEAFGSVIIEALACGLPVITSARAGAAIAVRHGTNGLLQQDPLDAAELTELLAQGLDAPTRERWRLAAAASASGYEWSAIMARMEVIFGEVVNR